MTLLASLRQFFLEQGVNRTYWIAYSGGVDSHALLYACAQLQSEIPLKLQAIHADHGLNPQSGAWRLHCKKTCDDLNIDYHEEVLSIKVPVGESLEKIARDARYAALAKYLSEDDVLLTAHHQDDQAETFLLQLLRGSGINGLAAMPSIKPLAKGFHARPLLAVSRETIVAFATLHGLTWIEDDTNHQVKFTRNYVRHDVIPLLSARIKNISAVIARSSSHIAEAKIILDEVAADTLSNVGCEKNNTIFIDKLATLSSEKQMLTVRYWIAQAGQLVPDSAKLTEFLRQIFTARRDRHPELRVGTYVLKRCRNEIIFKRLEQPLTAPILN